MNFRHLFFLLAFAFGNTVMYAQSGGAYALNFQPVFGGRPLELENSFYQTGASDSVRIELLKFYVSGIEFLQNEKVVWKEEKSFHLIDVSDTKSTRLYLPVPSGAVFNTLKFNIGIDSLTNVSGAIGGDLDPTKGMYWTWQNGYINFKIEGESNVCPTRKNQFQFHIGGYQSPFATIQPVVLKATPNACFVYFDIQKMLAGIDLVKQNQVMSPGAEAVSISVQIVSAFSGKGP